MSVYSGTYAPVVDNPLFTLGDPIVHARDELRLAARVPFAAARPLIWQATFCRHASGARSALDGHIARAALPDSPLNVIERSAPQLRPIVLRQRDEHDVLSRQADELIELSTNRDSIDIWQMIELSEKAILLEMGLARHHNRLAQLAYEVCNSASATR